MSRTGLQFSTSSSLLKDFVEVKRVELSLKTAFTSSCMKHFHENWCVFFSKQVVSSGGVHLFCSEMRFSTASTSGVKIERDSQIVQFSPTFLQGNVNTVMSQKRKTDAMRTQKIV